MTIEDDVKEIKAWIEAEKALRKRILKRLEESFPNLKQ